MLNGSLNLIVLVLVYLRNIPVIAEPVIQPRRFARTIQASHHYQAPAKENRRLMLIREEQAAVRPPAQYLVGGADAGL
jgi:hypothetical protein